MKRPVVTDLQVLEGFAEPFIVDDAPRDERMAQRWGYHIKQVYALWSKPRFTPYVESGVSQRSGWLTDAGQKRLVELRKLIPEKVP